MIHLLFEICTFRSSSFRKTQDKGDLMTKAALVKVRLDFSSRISAIFTYILFLCN